MNPIRIINAIRQHQWGITEESFALMLSIVDGDENLDPEAYFKFHALCKEEKLDLLQSSVFGRYVEGTRYSSINRDVGYLTIDGPIIPRATMFSDVSGLVSLDRLTEEYVAFEENVNISRIALLIDSPGGVVTGISDFSDRIRSSKKEAVSFSWMAASAAYQIAASTEKMYGPTSGVWGSIGTVLSVTNTKKRDEKNGVEHYEIVSSQSPDKRPDVTTKEGRAVYQKLVDELAADFVSRVAADRGVTEEYVLENFGRGGLVVGKSAQAVSMVDHIVDVKSFVQLMQGESILQEQTISASADTKEVIEMAIPKLSTAEELRREYPEAAEQLRLESYDSGFSAGRAKGAEDEKNRVQGIMGIMDKPTLAAAIPPVRDAARAAIDKHMFDVGATVETVQGHVLEATLSAQTSASENYGSRREASAQFAEHASRAAGQDPNQTDEQKKHKANVGRLVFAMDQVSASRRMDRFEEVE